MPTDFVFRLSSYLPLALACACVGYAERAFLPEVPVIAAVVVVALVALFRLETRVPLLSIPDANRLGLVVGLVYFGWAVLRVVREINTPTLPNLEWQLLLVALFGPLLMISMPAKLARREKHAGDFWWLHGAALAAAGLSGAIAEDAVAFALIGLYALCAVWSLALLHLRRAAGAVPAIPGRPPGPRVAGVVADAGPRSGFRGTLGLVAVALGLVVPLYLVTPRSPAAKLDFGKSRVEISYSADQMVNLNQTGELTANDQIAFEVEAEADGQPHTGLSPDQLWRGRVLRRYANAEWTLGELPLPSVEGAPRFVPLWTGHLLELPTLPTRPAFWTPPRLGPGQVTLTFTVPRAMLGQFLADPVTWVPGKPRPVATITPDGPEEWHWEGNGSFLWRATTGEEAIRYVQAWRPPTPKSDQSPPLRMIDSDPATRLAAILRNPVARVQEYADARVEEMIRAGQLPADCRERTGVNLVALPRPEYHERIARAFAHHLATTPELQYTTTLRRDRTDLDPIEEFLFHTKAGHCERFATALVLMLRSQGIPAVLVLGFKGCEPTHVPGRYVVRQEHAHAWVDALLPAAGTTPDARPRERAYRWTSLDPTPAGTAAARSAGGTTWLSGFGAWLREVYNEYVGNFTAEKRRKALAAIGRWLARPEVIAAGAVLALLLARRRFARRLAARGAPAEYPREARWFARLLEVLAARGFTPEPGQTPREFALTVAESLGHRPATATTAEVPLAWADAYYEARFGGVALAPERLAELDRGLADLEAALPRSRGA
jgi:transglutaminase-like putative cysteine protease